MFIFITVQDSLISCQRRTYVTCLSPAAKYIKAPNRMTEYSEPTPEFPGPDFLPSLSAFHENSKELSLSNG